MKKFFKVLFNIFWVIFAGLSNAICSAVMGVACFITIIGIPFGLQHFKFIKLVFTPAGRKVVTNFYKHPIMNILWLIFGGFARYLIQILLGVVFCVTIIGIPLGLQLFKIAQFNLAPFGAEIVWDGDYTNNKDTIYDYNLLFEKINANPSVTFSNKGQIQDVSYYIRNNQELIKSETQLEEKGNKLIRQLNFFAIIFAVLAVIIVCFVVLSNEETFVKFNHITSMIIIIIFTLIPMIIGFIISEICFYNIIRKPKLKLYKTHYNFLFTYYPNNAPRKALNTYKKGSVKNSFSTLACTLILLRTLPQGVYSETHNVNENNIPNDILNNTAQTIQNETKVHALSSGYSQLKEDLADYELLFNRINYNSDKVINKDGKEQTVAEYIKNNQDVLKEEQKTVKISKLIGKLVLILAPIIFILLVIVEIKFYFISTLGYNLLISMLIITAIDAGTSFYLYYFISTKIFKKLIIKTLKTHYSFLFDYYLDGQEEPIPYTKNHFPILPLKTTYTEALLVKINKKNTETISSTTTDTTTPTDK